MLSDDMLRQMVDAMPTPVAVTDGDRRYVYLNRAYETMFDLRLDTAVGRVAERSPSRERVVETTIFAAGDGIQYSLHLVHTHPVPAAEQSAAMEAELRGLRSEVARMRETDPVTRALSRRALRAHTDDAIGPSTAGVLRISVDDYEAVRADFGLDIADDLLAHFGDVVHENTRPGDLFARVGASEFTLVLREADREQTAVVARRICAAANEARTEQGKAQLALSVTVGAAYSDAADLELSSLIDEAEEAMHRATPCRNEVVIA